MRARLAVALVLLCTTSAAHAQVAIRVRTLDSASRPIANVSVSVIRGLNELIASGTTDDNGTRVFLLPVSGELQVGARQIGYRPAFRVVLLKSGDTVRADLTMSRLTTRLDTMRVTARASNWTQSRSIDADAIAASTRTLGDAMDVIQKLRPEMTYEPPDITGNCLNPIQNIWINGKHYFVPHEFATRGKKIIYNTQVIMQQVGSTARYGSAFHGASIPAMRILASIKPEHIEFMEYHDCMAHELGLNGEQSALFITLKDGVRFRYGVGSTTLNDGETDSLITRIRLPKSP